MSNDPITAEVIAANGVIGAGDRAGGRMLLEALWSRVEGRSPIHECIVAHILADAQDDPADELTWDLRALQAAERCSDADVQAHTPSRSVAAFMPSLHTSLAQDYLKVRELAHCREHLAAAQRFEPELADDAYGQTIRGAMASLTARLEAIARACQPPT